MNNKIKYTPMMEQYLSIKKNYPDAIVFFRLGDFYEMFFDDAILASKVLEIALTSRDAGNRVPMAGVPHHAAKVYIQKLITKGFKVALAEQITAPGNGLVEREVVRVISPGTIIEEGILAENENNFIGSLTLQETGYSLAYSDISTGESFVTYGLSKKEIFDLILRLRLKEVVVNSNYDEEIKDFLTSSDILSTYYENIYLINSKLTNHLNLEQKKAASHLINYLTETQKQYLNHLFPFELQLKENFMNVDYRIKKHLEILDSNTNNQKTTLLHFLDETKTAMGSRKLKYFLNHPLLDENELNSRFDFINAFSPYQFRHQLLEELIYVYDINRIVSRVAVNSGNARDLFQLKETLKRIPSIKAILFQYNNPIISKVANSIDIHGELTDLLQRSIIDNPPISVKDGGIIKENFNSMLDYYRNISTSGVDWLENFTNIERERTGIRNLKVGFNRIFGYYIEISKGNIPLVKEEYGYERKQTLTNSERYINEELKEKEQDLLFAKDKRLELEYQLFIEIRNKVKKSIESLQKLATVLANIDVYISQAVVAEKYNYVRPTFNHKGTVNIINGRHPVVEHFSTFVKNDVLMKPSEIFLITGPNMSGKSTYMRMFALIVYMAQTGFFVPADVADLPIYDAIFTRIGSSDDLSGGKSTFMVEMVESNDALTRATSKSLILFDEIGRGTATYDGMALAQGMIEYIHEKIGAQTLFSTHYHELTKLEKFLPKITNLHVKAREEKNTMVFLHQVEKGASDKSYGLQVASLAQLPVELIKRSTAILRQLEKEEISVSVDFSKTDNIIISSNREEVSSDQTIILNDLKKHNIDKMTPLDALVLLKYYQDLLKSKE